MTDPAGSERIQQDLPTASRTGDDSAVGDSFDDVPLTRDEALERDASAKADSDVADSDVADSDVADVERAGPGDGL